VDGDPATAWETETYRNRADFGGLKTGVGIVIDLQEQRTVTGAQVQTATPGISVQLRTAGDPKSDPEGWTPASELTPLQETTTLSTAPVETRYLMLWITGDLASVGPDRWRAAINELAVTVQPS